MRYEASTASQALPRILSDLLNHGDEVGSRNGRVKEILNAQIVITDPQHREIICLNRKANVFAQIAETMWVLAGRSDVEWLSAYLPRAKDFSDDGETWRGGYGPRIRQWGGWPHQDKEGAVGIDQIDHIVSLLREDPLSRRAVVSIYDPRVDTNPGKDIPCNDFLQFQSRLGALHLTVTVRSNDVMWGWSGINAFEWSTLQEIVAHLLGNTVGTLTFNIGNLHLYERHWEKARRIEHEVGIGVGVYSINPFQMPDLWDRTLENVDLLIHRWFEFERKCRKGEVTPGDLDYIEEPMLKSWAAAIAYFWTREDHWLGHLSGTALAVAVARTPASVLSEAPQTSRSPAPGAGHNLAAHERVGAFYAFVKDLHATKHASYGDSWKKRGEKMSILANMARKVDRLGVGDEYDSSADTLIDLLVYAVKYGCWLKGADDGPDNVNFMLTWFLAETEEFDTAGEALDIALQDITDDFNRYCDAVDDIPTKQKCEYVTELALRVAPIARDIWWDEQVNLGLLPDGYRGADAD